MPGRNCCHVGIASHASVLIDYAAFYRALYESIIMARHSVYILGWDIDSRIELLRGEEAARASCPTRFFDLIRWKARQNPDVQIFLNRWDYSPHLILEREALTRLKWRLGSPDNVQFCLDGKVPLGACHHQKVIVIDDELAFCGGMDVARCRWDLRKHPPDSRNRVDPPGTYRFGWERFDPYHDAQMLVAGPAVHCFAHLVRDRWQNATGRQPSPMRNPAANGLPPIWPPSAPIHFTNVQMAVSLTQPAHGRVHAALQIKQLYLDMIARAEQFIYMENQYFCELEIASALNQRLREKPALRLLLVSSLKPSGYLEGKAMWHGRVRFMDIVKQGGLANRVLLAYPISNGKGMEKPVHIHSKLMIVDDCYLRIGSSNINNRSMGTDTECDLVLEAQEAGTRRKISLVLADLIREHTGRSFDAIDQLISGGGDVARFLEKVPGSNHHLCKVNDECYRHERLAGLMMLIADPRKPFFAREKSDMKHSKAVRIGLAVLLVALLGLAWKLTPLSQYATPDYVVPKLDTIRNTVWAVPAAMGIYTVGTLAFFPHMVMTAVIVLVFSPLQAFCICMSGSLLSGSIGYGLGRLLGIRSLKWLIGDTAGKISLYAKKGGIVGITLLRLLPIAPYTAVNIALAMLEVPFMVFLIGTFLGTLPGTAIASLLGFSLLELWQKPDPYNIMLVGGGLAAWVMIIALSHLGNRYWQRKRRSAA